MLITLALVIAVVLLFWLGNFYSPIEIWMMLSLLGAYLLGWI